MSEHDRNLSTAFDEQAAKFEVAPIQSDPKALERLVRQADLPPGSLILDAGCGPGLVASAFLEAGHRVVGVDLSAEMIERARLRCASFGDRAQFLQGSIYELDPGGPCDAAISRFVLHHVADPLAFLQRQADLIRNGGVIVLCDHTADPNPKRADWQNAIERLRDHTHTQNLSPGTIVDLFVRVGLGEIRMVEESFALDLDEWFDRGSPTDTKAAVRRRLLEGPPARGFRPVAQPDGAVRIESWRSIVRGVKQGP